MSLRETARVIGLVIAPDSSPHEPTAAGQREHHTGQPCPSTKTVRLLVEFQFRALGQLANVSGHGDELTSLCSLTRRSRAVFQLISKRNDAQCRNRMRHEYQIKSHGHGNMDQQPAMQPEMITLNHGELSTLFAEVE